MRCCCCKCAGTVTFDAVALPAGKTVLSQWTERRGDCLRATLDLLKTTAGSLTVALFTKASSQAGDGGEVDVTTRIVRSTTGRTTVEWGPRTGSGLKDLVRYQFQVATGTFGITVFRMLPPVWFDTVRLA